MFFLFKLAICALLGSLLYGVYSIPGAFDQMWLSLPLFVGCVYTARNVFFEVRQPADGLKFMDRTICEALELGHLALVSFFWAVGMVLLVMTVCYGLYKGVPWLFELIF